MALASLPPPIGGSGSKYLEFPGLTATPENDIYATTGSVFVVEVDCSANTGEDIFLRFFDHATPTVGTDDAEMVLVGKAGKTTPYAFPRGIPFGTAISIAAVKEAGGGSGATAPSGTVDVKLVIGATP